jgi:hypothetical protein
LLPDGKRILFTPEGGVPKVHTQDVGGGKLHAITREGVISLSYSVSPDGKFFVGRGSDEKFYLYPIDGGQPRLLPEFQQGEEPIQWSTDGISLYLFNPEELPCPIYRINTITGERTLVRKLMPSDALGVTGIESVRLTPDEQTFAYSYYRSLSTMYLVGGLQ